MLRTFFKAVVLLFLMVPSFAVAQSGEEDVIYFKNGEILRGEILERDEQEGTLKIETAGRNIFLVSLEEVKVIRREEIPVPEYFKKSGYMNNTGVHILPGGESTSVKFEMVNGYRLTPKFSAGLGIGFVLYSDPLNLVPLFFDMKYKILEANTAPFVYLKSGYSFSLLTDTDIPVERHRGGFMLNPGMGLQFETGAGYGWYFQVGYNVDHSNYEQERFDGRIVENDISYRRLIFGLGLSF